MTGEAAERPWEEDTGTEATPSEGERTEEPRTEQAEGQRWDDAGSDGGHVEDTRPGNAQAGSARRENAWPQNAGPGSAQWEEERTEDDRADGRQGENAPADSRRTEDTQAEGQRWENAGSGGEQTEDARPEAQRWENPGSGGGHVAETRPGNTQAQGARREDAWPQNAGTDAQTGGAQREDTRPENTQAQGSQWQGTWPENAGAAAQAGDTRREDARPENAGAGDTRREDAQAGAAPGEDARVGAGRAPEGHWYPPGGAEQRWYAPGEGGRDWVVSGGGGRLTVWHGQDAFDVTALLGGGGFPRYEELYDYVTGEPPTTGRAEDAVQRITRDPRGYAYRAAALLTAAPPPLPGSRRDVRERLRELDAVTSLLPWEVRAKLTVSTGERALRGAYFSPVDGPAPGLPLLPEGAAAQYARTLADWFAKARGRTELTARIRHLTVALADPGVTAGSSRPGNTAEAALTVLHDVVYAFHLQALAAVLGRDPRAVPAAVAVLTTCLPVMDGRDPSAVVVDAVADYVTHRTGSPGQALAQVLCLAGIDAHLDAAVTAHVHAALAPYGHTPDPHTAPAADPGTPSGATTVWQQPQPPAQAPGAGYRQPQADGVPAPASPPGTGFPPHSTAARPRPPSHAGRSAGTGRYRTPPGGAASGRRDALDLGTRLPAALRIFGQALAGQPEQPSPLPLAEEAAAALGEPARAHVQKSLRGVEQELRDLDRRAASRLLLRRALDAALPPSGGGTHPTGPTGPVSPLSPTGPTGPTAEELL